MGILQKATMLLAVALAGLAGLAEAASPELPVSYRINSPLVVSDESWVVSVYQKGDLAAARQHRADQPGLAEQAAAGEVDWGRAYTYIAGEATGGRLAKHQSLGMDIWQVAERAALEPGVLYRQESRGDLRWSVENLELSFEPGGEAARVAGLRARHYVLEVSYDFRRVEDGEGGEKRERVRSRRDFWFAPALPFSPVQLLPLHIHGSTFVNFAPARVQRTILARLENRMRELGMLVRTRLELGGEQYDLEVSRLESAPCLALAGLRSMPVIPKSKVAAVQGPLFLAEMLQGSLPGGGEARLSFARGEGQPPLEVSGAAGYALMDSGDLVIASVFGGGGGPEGMLLLLRPHHGLAQAGRHPAARRKPREQLRRLSAAELKEYAKGFQAFALLRDAEGLTAYTGALEGRVNIEAGGEKRLQGSCELTMESLTVVGEGPSGAQKVAASFQAPPGLEVRLQSPASRLLP